MASGSCRVQALLACLLVLTALAPPVLAQGDAPRTYVPQSLWGVKDDVGLDLGREFLTNYGDRSFWQARPTGEGVRVAVIDTGIDLSHPDLQGTLACDHCWLDLVNHRPEPYDNNGHGTHIAGIIAGRGHVQANPLESYFPTGARGLATGSELIVAKAMNNTGGGSDEAVAEAIRWSLDPDRNPATDDGAHIVHLSLGVRAPEGSTPASVDTGSKTDAAVEEAIDQGVFVVMSAGNQGAQGPATPGGVDGVIAVGALDTEGELVHFSNRGPGVDVFAPGVIMSAWPEALDEDGIKDGYTGMPGTSQAAPVVTGALALVLEANPDLKGSEGGATKVRHIESLVRSTGQPVGPDASTILLDANALFTTQDKGTDGIAVGVVTGLGLIVLLILLLVGRFTFRALAKHAEQYDGENGAEGATGLGEPDGREGPAGGMAQMPAPDADMHAPVGQGDASPEASEQGPSEQGLRFGPPEE